MEIGVQESVAQVGFERDVARQSVACLHGRSFEIEVEINLTKKRKVRCAVAAGDVASRIGCCGRRCRAQIGKVQRTRLDAQRHVITFARRIGGVEAHLLTGTLNQTVGGPIAAIVGELELRGNIDVGEDRMRRRRRLGGEIYGCGLSVEEVAEGSDLPFQFDSSTGEYSGELK